MKRNALRRKALFRGHRSKSRHSTAATAATPLPEKNDTQQRLGPQQVERPQLADNNLGCGASRRAFENTSKGSPVRFLITCISPIFSWASQGLGASAKRYT